MLWYNCGELNVYWLVFLRSQFKKITKIEMFIQKVCILKLVAKSLLLFMSHNKMCLP